MATHASAEKRHRQSLKRRTHHRWWKTKIYNASKEVVEVASKKETAQSKSAKDVLIKAISTLSKAKSKGVIHKNTARRKISRLSKRLAAAAK